MSKSVRFLDELWDALFVMYIALHVHYYTFSGKVKGEGTGKTEKERKGGAANGESKIEDSQKRGCVLISSFTC
jgi:hypothetical protein